MEVLLTLMMSVGLIIAIYFSGLFLAAIVEFFAND